jgi:hypothetical protein
LAFVSLLENETFMTNEPTTILARQMVREPNFFLDEINEELRCLLLDYHDGALSAADAAEMQIMIDSDEQTARLWSQLQATKKQSPDFARFVRRESDEILTRLRQQETPPQKKTLWWPFGQATHQRLAAQSDDQIAQPIDGTAGDAGQVFYTLRSTPSGCVEMALLTNDQGWQRLCLSLGGETRTVELKSAAGEWFAIVPFEIRFDQLGVQRPLIVRAPLT